LVTHSTPARAAISSKIGVMTADVAGSTALPALGDQMMVAVAPEEDASSSALPIEAS
jgi:hypothetical protein